MFQYALGKSAASFYKTDLSLDIQDFKLYKLRNFELNQFCLNYKLATKLEIFRYWNSIIHKLMRHIFSRSSKSYYSEGKWYYYDKSVFTKKKDTYFYGYRQSEKYFLSIRDQLLKDFVPKIISPLLNKYIMKLSWIISIGLHVRRGDYVSLWLTVCDELYYQNALQYFHEHLNQPFQLIVFSDDIDWVKQNYNFLDDFSTIFIDWLSGPESIYLMSLCNHFVIANSTFSWWGAWLIQNSNKKIIAPKERIKNIETPDIIPESWIKI